MEWLPETDEHPIRYLHQGCREGSKPESFDNQCTAIDSNTVSASDMQNTRLIQHTNSKLLRSEYSLMTKVRQKEGKKIRDGYVPENPNKKNR